MAGPKNQATYFATTCWTLVGDAAGEGETEAREALGALFDIYWAPLYRYVRRLGKNAQDAEDLVQGFFAHLLQGNGLRLADPERGRFRAFLLGALKHYMANDWRREHRIKRGGFTHHLSIDWRQAESGLGMEPADGRSPDRLFNRDWALALLDRVLDDLSQADGAGDFDRWKPYLSLSSDRLPYAEMAERFGISEGAARVAVHRLRKRYRKHLREEIRRTLEDERMVDDEMQALFSALAEDFS